MAAGIPESRSTSNTGGLQNDCQGSKSLKRKDLRLFFAGYRVNGKLRDKYLVFARHAVVILRSKWGNEPQAILACLSCGDGIALEGAPDRHNLTVLIATPKLTTSIDLKIALRGYHVAARD